MKNKALNKLKIISMIGGIYEILFGIMMIFFILPLLNLLGLNITSLDYPIFSQTAGLLAMILGLILFASSFNVERFQLNILLIILLRFMIQIILIYNTIIIPSLALGLVSFGLIDLIFALLTIVFIKKSKLSMNLLKVIKPEVA
ncbi:MAG: hypothetical protein GF317_00775 [Candidatus Lokiarchaeota archaeon]|nr:hypothetical protein [Candidatus Lokiarchaeota archaeon]MBD3198494.1 hypothetical protein [Candidatus Lokiarchaeota archaeon]